MMAKKQETTKPKKDDSGRPVKKPKLIREHEEVKKGSQRQQ